MPESSVKRRLQALSVVCSGQVVSQAVFSALVLESAMGVRSTAFSATLAGTGAGRTSTRLASIALGGQEDGESGGHGWAAVVT